MTDVSQRTARLDKSLYEKHLLIDKLIGSGDATPHERFEAIGFDPTKATPTTFTSTSTTVIDQGGTVNFPVVPSPTEAVANLLRQFANGKDPAELRAAKITLTLSALEVPSAMTALRAAVPELGFVADPPAPDPDSARHRQSARGARQDRVHLARTCHRA